MRATLGEDSASANLGMHLSQIALPQRQQFINFPPLQQLAQYCKEDVSAFGDIQRKYVLLYHLYLAWRSFWFLTDLALGRGETTSLHLLDNLQHQPSSKVI